MCSFMILLLCCLSVIFVAECQARYHINNENKTLAILFQSSYGTTTAKIYLGLKFSQAIQNISYTISGYLFNNYILYPFDSTSNKPEWYSKIYTNDPTNIQNALGNITNYQCPGGMPCESKSQCPRPILSVINDTLNDPMFASGSTIILFTQSSVEDLENQNSVYENVQRKQARILVIIPDTVFPCGMSWEDTRNQAFQTMTQISGGDLFVAQSRDITNIILPIYLSSFYKNSIVETYTYGNCSNDEVTISVELMNTELSIVYFGNMPTVSITDESNKMVVLPNMINSPINFYSVYQPSKIGKYKIIGSSNKKGDTCLLSVHSNDSPQNDLSKTNFLQIQVVF